MAFKRFSLPSPCPVHFRPIVNQIALASQMHIHGKRMADYNTGFVAPRLPKRGVLHPSKRGSYLSEAKRRRKRSRYSLLSTFLLFILSSRLTIFTFAPLSLSHSSSFAFQRMEFDRLASPSSEFLVTRPTSFFVSSRVKWLLWVAMGNGFIGSSCFLRNLTAR